LKEKLDIDGLRLYMIENKLMQRILERFEKGIFPNAILYSGMLSVSIFFTCTQLASEEA